MKIPPHKPTDYRLLAGSYSLWEYLVFGGKLQRCRNAWWNEIEGCQRLLVLGDGNGRFSTLLLQNFPRLLISSLDASRPMLRAAKKRRRRLGISDQRITEIHEDVRLWNHQAAEPFDAVVAQFFFDSFQQEDLTKVIQTIRQAVIPGGKLLVSEFNIPNDTRRGNLKGRVILRVLYFLFAVLTRLKTRKLVPHTPVLLCNGFELMKESHACGKLLVSQVFRAADPGG